MQSFTHYLDQDWIPSQCLSKGIFKRASRNLAASHICTVIINVLFLHNSQSMGLERGKLQPQDKNPGYHILVFKTEQHYQNMKLSIMTASYLCVFYPFCSASAL